MKTTLGNNNVLQLMFSALRDMHSCKRDIEKNNKIKYDRNNMLLLCYAMYVVILGSPQISDVYKTLSYKL